MRYAILAASVLIQVCIGGLYAWSEFVPALMKTHGLTPEETQLIFGVLIMVFTMSMVVAGRLLERIGPRWIVAVGGLLFGGGYVIAGRSGGDFLLLLLGVGVVVGVGTGFCYVCPLTMCSRWFPRHKGLVTGVAVAGFGAGAVVLVSLAEILFARDMDVLAVFETVGVAYGVAVLVAALPLRFPDGEAPARPPVAFGVLTRDRGFWALALGMFGGTFAGLLFNGNLKPMITSTGVSAKAATVAISAFAVGNAAGRIGWGWITDRIGGRAVPLSLVSLAAAVALAMVVMDSAVGAVVVSALVGAGFGASFVVYAARTAAHFGADRLGAVYPLVFLAYGVSGLLGPFLGALVYDLTDSYSGGLVLSLAVLAVSVVGYSALRGAVDGPAASPPAE